MAFFIIKKFEQGKTFASSEEHTRRMGIAFNCIFRDRIIIKRKNKKKIEEIGKKVKN